jgi:thymidylate synthase
MQQHQDLLRRIRTRGRRSPNRTGIDTIKIFGHQMVFNLQEGFPLVTTRKMYPNGGIRELIWFLKGETNNKGLTKDGVNIWSQWALAEDVTVLDEIIYQDRVVLYADEVGMGLETAHNKLHEMAQSKAFRTVLAELDAHNIPTHKRRVIHEEGELGPIYGAQWRRWKTSRRDSEGNPVLLDQIQYVVDTLRKNPNSRRIIVTAWNPEVLPDESLSPQENVKKGNQALAACHTLYQFGTLPMELHERLSWAANQYEHNRETLTGNAVWRAFYETYIEGDASQAEEAKLTEELDRLNIPKHFLNLMLYQRSADVPVGVPTNIMSYALLLSMMAHVTNMVPFDFVHAIADAHIYSDQIEGVDEQLSREPMPLPTLWLNPNVKELDDFTFEDIEIRDYVSHKAIKYPVAT